MTHRWTPMRDPRPNVRTLLADPAVRTPLKTVLRGWAERDPVDAAEDANLLALAFERVADELCGRAWHDGVARPVALAWGEDHAPPLD